MNTFKNKIIVLCITILFLTLVIEPTLATDETEIEQINVEKLIQEFLDFIAYLLEYAASIVRQGAEVLMENRE